MTWSNPWAWLGLATLALPVLIHLLGRGHAKVLPFPSLRFLERSKFLPTRRTRLQDIPLLIVRLGILVAAVAALAQPFFVTRDRTAAASASLVRAILVDTSASMRRAATSGSQAVDVARREATRLASEASASIVIETNDPARDLRGASTWLERQAGRLEIVVVSDFQTGAITAADVAAVPPFVGFRATRVDVAPGGPAEVAARSDAGGVLARATATDVEWSVRPAAPTRDIVLLSGAADRAAADAAARAAASVGVRLPVDTTRGVAVVFPSYEGRAALLQSSAPIDAPWMTDLVARLRGDSLLVIPSTPLVIPSEARDLGRGESLPQGPRSLALLGMTIVKGQVDGRERLLLFATFEPASLTAAALIAAIDNARSTAVPLSELDPAAMSDAELAQLQRAPSSEARPSSENGSDGRWFWIAALALLVLETWMRRTPKPSVADELVHDRAA